MREVFWIVNVPASIPTQSTPSTRVGRTERDRSAFVCVIDPDPAVRHALSSLLASEQLTVKTFISAEEFLDSEGHDGAVCLITELNLPGKSGLELLTQLNANKIKLPAILLASESDVPTAVQIIRAGAVDFIEKPFVHRTLVNKVRAIIRCEQDHK